MRPTRRLMSVVPAVLGTLLTKYNDQQKNRKLDNIATQGLVCIIVILGTLTRFQCHAHGHDGVKYKLQ